MQKKLNGKKTNSIKNPWFKKETNRQNEKI